MTEYRRSSFLMESAPQIYAFLKDLRPYAGIYALILAIAFTLSLFFQWKIIKFFIDSMMGWTIFAVPFVGVLIVMADIEFKVNTYEYPTQYKRKWPSYNWSMAYGIFLCLVGLTALFFSHRYKQL